MIKHRYESISWHRIESARVPRVATSHPPRSQPKPSNYAMLFYRFACVVGATRVKTAIQSKQWANQVFVAPQHGTDQFSHRPNRCSKPSISARNTDFFSPAGARERRNTRSYAGNRIRDILNASRASRLIRLRSTERRASFLATTTPRRAEGKPAGRYRSWKCSLRIDFRKAKTDEKSSVLLSRSMPRKDRQFAFRAASASVFRPKVEPDLWHGAHEAQTCHRASENEPESRACACGGRLRVDMCVS